MATALYRRYRPESFAEVIGQDHVTTPLRRALRAGRVGHAYLFSGPRGCGKTTSARILARCLNCEQGPTDTPCGTCDSCRDLARGGAGSLDVVEIDAASHGGVDDARELRERASFAPVRDRFKVFIIDEAHMVTSAGFNALLKLVEEPPDHVKFVFATTEPDKVIGTIRSRTHHYPFRLIPPQVLGPYLEEVCAAEDVQVGEGVMPLVVRAGGGSARDSMSVLDQLMAGAGEDGLDFPTAIALLGFTDTALLDQAVTAIAERDAAALYSAVEHVLATGHEPRRFVEDLLERMRDLIVLAAVPDKGADLLPQVPAGELERMLGQAAQFAPADLSQCGDLVHETLSTMSGATSPRLHLELLAARLVLRDERAALAAADAPAPQGGAPQGGAGAGRGAQDRSGAAPTGGGGGREEARRIAQERAEAARQARGGGRPASAAAPSAPPAPTQDAPAAAQGGSAQGEPTRTAPSQDSSWGALAGAGAGAGAGQASGDERREPQGGQGEPGGQGASAPTAPSSADARTAPQSGPSGPQGGPSSPHGGPTAPQGGPAGPQGDQSTPQGAGPAPQGASGAPQNAPAAPQGAPASGGGIDADAVRGHWSAILDELQQIRRPSWALISQNAHVNGVNGSTLVLGFRTEGLVSAFRRGTAAENLADAVRRIMHIDVMVDAVVGEDPGPGSAGPGGAGPGGGGPAGPGSAGRGPGGNGPGGAGPGNAGPGGPADFGDPGGPGGRGGSGDWAPRGQGPVGQEAPGPGGQGGGASGGPTAEDPSGGQAPRTGGAPWGDAASAMAPRDPAPARAPSVPGSAAPSAAPSAAASAGPSSAAQPAAPAGGDSPERQEPASIGQRASERAMAAAARAARNAPAGHSYAPADDFPPEPDDPYPPDPEEYGPPAQHQPPTAAPGGGRWSEALEDRGTGAGGPATPSRSAAAAAPSAPSASGASASTASAAGDAPGEARPGAASAGPPLEVEDEGRDRLPAEEPRTFGQNALKRALAEGRVVRSLPAAHLAQGADASASGPGEAPVQEPEDVAQGGDMPREFTPAPEVASPTSPDTAPPAGLGRAVPHDDPAQPSGQDAPSGADGSAAARATSSWGAAAAVTGTASGSAPSASAAPSAPPAAAPTAAPAAPPAADAPRSGAALVREAAMASRTAGQRLRGGRGQADQAPEADPDPTGGATRDDEDAVVATRNGREVIEKMLGGRVLEVIDETRPR